MMGEDTEFVKFWNEVLAPKFIKFKHILVDGLTLHSEAIFPTLPVNEGDRVIDVGGAVGDLGSADDDRGARINNDGVGHEA